MRQLTRPNGSKNDKDRFTPRTHCPSCGSDLAAHGFLVFGQMRCKPCHVANAPSSKTMHRARWSKENV